MENYCVFMIQFLNVIKTVMTQGTFQNAVMALEINTKVTDGHLADGEIPL